MPIQKCQDDNKPGYRWGKTGKCYTYTPDDEVSRKKAKKKAIKQGVVIESPEGFREKAVLLQLLETEDCEDVITVIREINME